MSYLGDTVKRSTKKSGDWSTTNTFINGRLRDITSTNSRTGKSDKYAVNRGLLGPSRGKRLK